MKKRVVVALGHRALGTTLPDQKLAVNSCRAENIQAKIDLIEHIEAIGNSANHSSNVDIKNIRSNRKREQTRTRVDYVNGGERIV